MGKIFIDFVIDATESDSGNLPAINLFCDDLIVKGLDQLVPFHNLFYGITVFYGRGDEVKIYEMNHKLFTSERYEFNRVFDMIDIGGGSFDGRDNILGGIKTSGQKLEQTEADLRIMIVFSDSYVSGTNVEQTGLLPAQIIYLYLSDSSDLGAVDMKYFWGLFMKNKHNRVDHRLMPKRESLTDLFDHEKREKQIDSIMDHIVTFMK